MKVVTTDEMRRIEREADAGGLSYTTMMENAGRSVAEACQRIGIAGRRILVLIGPGNNGGDGLVAGRYLHNAGAHITLYIWKRSTEGDENFRLTQELGIPAFRSEEDEDMVVLRSLLKEADIVVDALLGTGISRPIGGSLCEILKTTREEVEERKKRTLGEKLLPIYLPPTPLTPSFPIVVAVDVPTGLNSDTGEVDPATLPADITVTFGFPKRGHLLFPGANYVGKLLVADIGISPALAEEIKVELATSEMVRSLLPKRPIGAHKGTFGKALIVAGSVNYIGAAYFASAGATRVGAGLVTLALAESIHPILASKLSEATFLLLPEDMGVLVPEAVDVLAERISGYDAILLGPGLGREKKTIAFVRRLLGVELGRAGRIGFLREGEERHLPSLPPLVIDADGLNALADTPGWWKSIRGLNVLTPHPGEMSRLTGLSIAEIEADRISAALKAAEEWKQIVVLKGAYTIVSSPDGRIVINPFANPGLATAGSGDVLAGAIVGFLAQGLEPFAAAIAGAYIHGLAGELVREELGDAGMVAGDLLPYLPKAIKLVGTTI